MPKMILFSSSSLDNKGDALMALAVRRRMGDSFRYSIPANVAVKSPRALRGYSVCLWCDRPPTTGKRFVLHVLVEMLRFLLSPFPKAALEKLKIVRPKDIDIVMDVSGYCYGDPWGPELIAYLSRAYQSLKKQNIPIIFLPKTWGPFKTIKSSLVRSLLSSAEIVFARDLSSLDELKSHISVSEQNKIHFAPDYTHEVALGDTRKNSHPDNLKTVYFIPSYRVIDSRAFTVDEYCRLLDLARRRVIELGGEPCLLLHETASDKAMVLKLCRLGFDQRTVVLEEDPLKLKNLIAQSFGVVTSRLHGLYNALNAAVPPVVIPWNFKYKEALALYSCESQLVDTEDAEISIIKAIDNMFCAAERAKIQRSCKLAAPRLENASENMWSLVKRAALS